MISKYLRNGDRIELEIKNYTLGEQLQKPLSSRVITVSNEEALYISEPWLEGSTTELSIGEQFEMRFNVSEESYLCNATVMGTAEKNGLPVYILKLLSEPRKNMRRKFFRVEKRMPLKLDSKTDERPSVDGTMINISGGGLKFSSTVQSAPGKEYCFKLFTKGEDAVPVELECRIIDSYPNNKQQGKYDNRAVFVNVDRESREDIIQFIFREERRKKRVERDIY